MLALKSTPVVACLLMDTIQISSYLLVSAALWPQQSSWFSTDASNIVLRLVMQMLRRLKSLMLCILWYVTTALPSFTSPIISSLKAVSKVDQAWLTRLPWLIFDNFSGLVSWLSHAWKWIPRGRAPWSFSRLTSLWLSRSLLFLLIALF